MEAMVVAVECGCGEGCCGCCGGAGVGVEKGAVKMKKKLEFWLTF